MGIDNMFYISAKPKIIKLLIALLEKNGFVVRETKLEDYIIVRNDPTAYIPDHLQNSVKIKEDDGDYTSFLKEAGRLRDILNPPKLQVGAAVLITEELYKDFKGIIKAVHDDDSYSVELSIWGRIVLVKIEAANVRGIAANFINII